MDPSPPINPKIEAVRQGVDAVELDFYLPDDLFYFQGHFPGFPILPGVVQIDWAIRYADQYLGTQINAGRKVQVKFKSIIQPGRLIRLALRMSKSGRRMEFVYSNEDGELSSGSVELVQK